MCMGSVVYDDLQIYRLGQRICTVSANTELPEQMSLSEKETVEKGNWGNGEKK